MKHWRKMIQPVVCFLLMVAILITSGIPSFPMQETVSAATVSISQSTADLIKGQAVQLSVSGTSKKITWSSTNKKIASVDEDGYVVAKKAGTATIKAKTGKKTLSCKVTVVNEGLNYKDSTVYVGDVLQMELLNVKGTVTWSTTKKSVATVNKKGKVTIKAKGATTIKATADGRTYTCKLTVKKAAITRGQWIHELVKKLNLTVPKKYDAYAFSDITNSKYKNAIQLAYEYGIIQQSDAGEFLPNAPATREFATFTAVKGLGLDVSTAKALTCKDKSTITYQKEVSKALELQMLSLSKKNFNPQKAISKADKNKILKVVKKYIDAVTVTKNVEKVEYKDNVQNVENKVEYSVASSSTEENMQVTIPAGSELAGVKEGEIIILPESSTSDPVAVKVNAIAQDAEGNLTISGTQPELGEVFDSIDIQKNLKLDLSGFVANTSVLKSVQFNDSNDCLEAELTLDDSSMKATPLEKEITLGNATELPFNYKKLSGSVTINAPVLTAIIEADMDENNKLSIDKFSVTLSNTIVGTASVPDGQKKETINIGHLKVDLGKGFNAWLVFNVVFSASGEAKVVCTLKNTVSYCYIKDSEDDPVTVSLTHGFDGTEVKGDAKLYLNTFLEVSWLGTWDEKKKEVKWDVEVAGINFDIGAGAGAEIKGYDTTPKICTNVSVYAYAEISLDKDDGLGYILTHMKALKNIPTSWTIWDDNDDNPHRVSFHFEDGKRIYGVCSHSTDVYTVTLNPNNGEMPESSKIVKVKVGQKFAPPADPSYNGYSFEGWFDKLTGGNKYTNYTKVNGNITLYAHWKQSDDLIVSFDKNGGTNLSFSSYWYKVGKTYGTLPTVIRKNYEFSGWYTKDGSAVNPSSKVERKNTMLYAKWEAMTKTAGYKITKYTGTIQTSKRSPQAYNIIYSKKNKKLTIYGGVGDYDMNSGDITEVKGYAWREYGVDSKAKISCYDSSVDEDEEDPWISLDISDLADELLEMDTKTQIIFKLNDYGIITEIQFIE
jgi:uncharacterized repeat protein (TIGR02543 family)